MQTAPALDLAALPAAQRAAVLALVEELAALREITRRQEHLIAELNHALHGKRSEKLSEDERQLAFEDLSIALAQVEAERDTRGTKAEDAAARPAPKRTIGNLPVALPRIEVVVEPEILNCPCGCGPLHRIGEDRTERLDIVPAQLRVIVTIRPRYACRGCTDGVTQAPAPTHLIPGGLPTEATLAQVLISKYADHLPLYRQSQILARAGLDLHRAVLADWVGKAAFHLRPIVDRLAEHLRRSGKLFMDETTAPVLDPGRGTTKTGYLWALARDDRAWGGEAPPGVVYFYAPGRAGENAEAFLTGFDGILQIDGYTGYNRLTKPSRRGGAPLRVAHCWAHARRKLKEVFDRDGSDIAAEGLRRIAELYAVEADIRGTSAGQRLAARQARSAPLVAAFRDWLQAAAPQDLRQIPSGREACLHPQSLGGAADFPHRWPGRDRQQQGGKHDPPPGPQSQERTLRGPRRGRCCLGSHRVADRDLQNKRDRTLRISQGDPRSPRERSPTEPPRRSPALELPTVKLTWPWGAGSA